MCSEGKLIDFDTSIHALMAVPLLPLPKIQAKTETEFLSVNYSDGSPFDSAWRKSFYQDDPFEVAVTKARHSVSAPLFSDAQKSYGPFEGGLTMAFSPAQELYQKEDKSFELSPIQAEDTVSERSGQKRRAHHAPLGASPGSESGSEDLLQAVEPSAKRQRVWRSYTGAPRDVILDWRPHVIKKMISSRIEKCIERAKRLARGDRGDAKRYARSTTSLPSRSFSNGSSGNESYGVLNVGFLTTSPTSGSSDYPTFREGLRNLTPGSQASDGASSEIRTPKKSQSITEEFKKMAKASPEPKEFLFGDGCEVYLVHSGSDSETSSAAGKEESNIPEQKGIPNRKSLPATFRESSVFKTSTPISTPTSDKRVQEPATCAPSTRRRAPRGLTSTTASPRTASKSKPSANPPAARGRQSVRPSDKASAAPNRGAKLQLMPRRKPQPSSGR